MALGGSDYGTGQYMEIAQAVQTHTSAATVLVIVIGGLWGDGYGLQTREQGPPIALLQRIDQLMMRIRANPRIVKLFGGPYGELGAMVTNQTNARASLTIVLNGYQGDGYCTETNDALASRWFLIWMERIVQEIRVRNN